MHIWPASNNARLRPQIELRNMKWFVLLRGAPVLYQGLHCQMIFSFLWVTRGYRNLKKNITTQLSILNIQSIWIQWTPWLVFAVDIQPQHSVAVVLADWRRIHHDSRWQQNRAEFFHHFLIVPRQSLPRSRQSHCSHCRGPSSCSGDPSLRSATQSDTSNCCALMA